MHRIDSAGHVGNLFGPGTPGVTEATEIDYAWMNAIQEELVHVILTQAGISLVKGTNTQLWAALIAKFGRLASTNTWSAVNTFSGGVTQTSAITTSSLSSGAVQLIGVYPVFNGSAKMMRLYTTEEAHAHGHSLTLTWNASWNGTAWVADVNGTATAISITPESVAFRMITSATTSPGDATFGSPRGLLTSDGVRSQAYISTASSPHNSVTAFSGRVLIKAGTSSTTINNAAFTTNCVPKVTMIAGAVLDATLTTVWCDILSGTLNIYGNANATSDVKVAFDVMLPGA
jgi:hypothetical protein